MGMDMGVDMDMGVEEAWPTRMPQTKPTKKTKSWSL